MSNPDWSAEWPIEPDEVPLTEAPETERAELSDLVQFSQTNEDELDAKYISVVSLLNGLQQSPAILALSDEVTNHMVTAIGFSVQERTCKILYHDPWGPERGSFLQKGKNVAGVEAQPAEGQAGCWVVTHLELACVFDGAIVVSAKDKPEEKKDSDS